MQRVKEYTESYFLPAGECNPQQEMPEIGRAHV